MPAPRLFTLALAGALALAIPVGELPWFSGLPLNNLPEAIGLVLLLPLLVVRSLRRVIVAECERIFPRRSGQLAAGLVALAIAAKIVLILSGGQVGWHACYRAVDQPVAAGSCERSYENPLFRDAATRFDRELAFGEPGVERPTPALSSSSWNLSFFNSSRFNQTEPEGYRERLPFEVEWTADVEADDEVVVSYVGEGRIAIDGQSTPLPPSYSRARTIVLRDLPSEGAAVVDFAFTPPGAGTGAIPRPYASINVSGVDPAGPTTVETALGAAVDVSMLVLLAALILCYAVLATRLGWHWLPAIALALALVIPAGDAGGLAVRTTLALLVMLAALLCRPSLRALLFAALGVIVINSIGVGHEFVTWDSVIYRSAGNDPLTYESFAREILETGSLRGGEDVFFYQPASRYILFVAHAILGDGDALLSVASRSAVSIAIIFAVGAAGVLRVARPIERIACFAAAACVLVVLNWEPEVVDLIDVGLSEWMVWAGIPVGFAMVVLAPSRRWVLIGTAILAACVLTRTHLGPALALVLAAALLPIWRTDRRLVLVSGGLFLALLCLPLLHNLAYGERFVLATTSGQVNVVLPLADLPRAISDPDVRSVLESQVRQIFYASPEASSEAILVALRILQATWLLGTIAVLVRWRRTGLAAKALAVTPAVMLAPFVTFQVHPYYPRHIVAGHILMAIVLALVVIPALTAERSRTGPG